MARRLGYFLQFTLWVSPSLLTAASSLEFIPLKIATGASHTCVLSTHGAVKCWGGNTDGQLGTGDRRARGNVPYTMGLFLTSVDLGSNAHKVTDICAGSAFTCASNQTGAVKCWGSNSAGQLGQGRSFASYFTMGDALPVTDLGKDFKVKALACGFSHACALSDQGLIKCWGENATGSLGLGDALNRGGRAEQMGDNLPTLADLSAVQSISAGNSHTCALSTEGVRCWGNGSEGQLGLESGALRGATPGTVPGKSPLINLSADTNETILNIAAANMFSCALMTSSTQDLKTFVKCWGYNGFGRLGTGNSMPYGLKLGTMGTKLPRVDLGPSDIVSMNPHKEFTCALSKLGQVKCWGMNQFGQLGVGANVNSKGSIPTDMGKNLAEVDLGLPVKTLSIGPSSQHSCAILINNEIKCWGSGDQGQLGYEITSDIGKKPAQMGEELPFVPVR